MSDTISLDWIGGQLRVIQAEQRTLRMENDLLRTTILNSLGDVVRVLSDRISNFEALLEARIDHMATSIEPRLAGLETRFDRLESRFDQLETRFDRFEASQDGFEAKMIAGFSQLAAQLERIEQRSA